MSFEGAETSATMPFAVSDSKHSEPSPRMVLPSAVGMREIHFITVEYRDNRMSEKDAVRNDELKVKLDLQILISKSEAQDCAVAYLHPICKKACNRNNAIVISRGASALFRGIIGA